MDWFSFILGLAIGVTLTHIFVIFFRGINSVIFTPADISDACPSLNGFGRWLLYLVIVLFSPVVFLFKVIYMLCHVGTSRKNKSGRGFD